MPSSHTLLLLKWISVIYSYVFISSISLLLFKRRITSSLHLRHSFSRLRSTCFDGTSSSSLFIWSSVFSVKLKHSSLPSCTSCSVSSTSYCVQRAPPLLK
ncbi:hypothetical protein K1719_017850 [Acacia pycnantha]|nr:hypothetical protein K1719_017850 [Acacia pycnantha]